MRAIFWAFCVIALVLAATAVLGLWGRDSRVAYDLWTAAVVGGCMAYLLSLNNYSKEHRVSSGAPIHEYDKVLVIEGNESPSMREIADADLVVYGDSGRVMKDRYGALRTLNESELRQAKEASARAS